jgi:hypothetical protein
MKKISIMIFMLIFISFSVFCEYYKVVLKRIDKDLYKDINSGVYIQTKYCYEYCYSDNAILSYDKYAFYNFIMFENGYKYEVVKIFK